MKKWLLMIFLLLPLLAGCGREQTDNQSTYTAPTLPSVDTTLSPKEQLSAAIEVLKSADSLKITYGTGEDIQTLTPPWDVDSLKQVKALIPNENFIPDLCTRGITLSPSNTGSLEFSLNGISAEEFATITGIVTEAESCSIALTIAPEGHLGRVELTMDDTVTFINIEK